MARYISLKGSILATACAVLLAGLPSWAETQENPTVAIPSSSQIYRCEGNRRSKTATPGIVSYSDQLFNVVITVSESRLVLLYPQKGTSALEGGEPVRFSLVTLVNGPAAAIIFNGIQATGSLEQVILHDHKANLSVECYHSSHPNF